jgi:4-hydroxybenzoate polyprenyltransferase
VSSTRLASYVRLVRLDRPIGILLLAWPTLWAVWIASDGHPGPHILFVFALGTILMRSAGCAVNDYADRDFDRFVERTRERPVTSGAIAPWEALLVAAVLSLAALFLLVGMNGLTWALACVAALIAASYPFTKRFFALPQAYLGIAFGFGIPMAFAAVQNALPGMAWVLLLANIFWAIAYDTEYAMVDREDDLKIGIRTAAITFGELDVAAIMLCYAATLACLAAVGIMANRGALYFISLGIAAALALYHYTLIRERQPAGCFAAFLNNNWLGAAVFLGLILDYRFR